MTFKTKAGLVGGSITTVVPSAFVEMLKLKKGDKIIWEADLEGPGTVITVHKEEAAEAK